MTTHAEYIPKWNIIFLIYAELVDTTTGAPNPPDDDDVRTQIEKLDSDILNIQLSDNLNLFTIKNSVEIKYNHVISDTTLITQLVFDSNQQKNIQKPLIKSQMQNFGQKGREIQNVFQFIDQTFPADKTLLITWDHGSVFGIFKKVIADEAQQHQKDSIFNKKYETLKTDSVIKNKLTGEEEIFCLVKNKKFNNEVRVNNLTHVVENTPETIVDILTNDELANAITYGFKNKYVDVLIMFNCDMQNMHTCYSMRASVKYFVAPESIISAPGYDYVSIINLIGKNKTLDVDGAMVAMHAVNTMKQYFVKAGRAEKFEEHAMFAVCLEGYHDKIIRFMKFFIEKMTVLIDTESIKYTVGNTRTKCFTFGNDLHYDLVDFLNFLNKLTRSTNNTEIFDLNEYFQIKYNSIIIAQAVGNAIYPNTGISWEQMTNTPPKGITIYFPITTLNYSDPVVTDFIIPNARYSTSLLTEINWINFITKLYKRNINLHV